MYSKRLELLNLPSLELRRLYFNLVWIHKIIFGHVDMRSDDFPQLQRTVLRTGIVSFTFVLCMFILFYFISKATVSAVFQPCRTCYCSSCTPPFPRYVVCCIIFLTNT